MVSFDYFSEEYLGQEALATDDHCEACPAKCERLSRHGVKRHLGRRSLYVLARRYTVGRQVDYQRVPLYLWMTYEKSGPRNLSHLLKIPLCGVLAFFKVLCAVAASAYPPDYSHVPRDMTLVF